MVKSLATGAFVVAALLAIFVGQVAIQDALQHGHSELIRNVLAWSILAAGLSAAVAR